MPVAEVDNNPLFGGTEITVVATGIFTMGLQGNSLAVETDEGLLVVDSGPSPSVVPRHSHNSANTPTRQSAGSSTATATSATTTVCQGSWPKPRGAENPARRSSPTRMSFAATSATSRPPDSRTTSTPASSVGRSNSSRRCRP